MMRAQGEEQFNFEKITKVDFFEFEMRTFVWGKFEGKMNDLWCEMLCCDSRWRYNVYWVLISERVT